MALSPVFVPLTEAVADAVSVAPSTMVKVAPVAGAVTVILLRLVAVATPRIGVTSVGLVASALAPLPVEVVTPVPPEATASVALKDAAEPEVFWFKVGKSAATAMLGTPVVVVFLSIPVARPDITTPLMATTVKAVAPVASPVCVALLTSPE